MHDFDRRYYLRVRPLYVLLALSVWLQTADTQVNSPQPTFAVASVKPSQDPRPFNDVDAAFNRAIANNSSRGRLRLMAVPVSLLIELAYGVGGTRLLDAPAWATTERYDIDARADETATFSEMRPMLQSLLADRFKFEFRAETRPLPVYELTAAGGGLKITPAKDGSCTPRSEPSIDARPLGPLTKCGSGRRYQNADVVRIEAVGITMSRLIEMLSTDADRPIVDRTNFAASFDLHLEFASAAATAATQSSPASSAASLFTALQEQLGLRLRAVRGPADVLVVTRLERPTPN